MPERGRANRYYRPADWGMVRAPLLPIDFYNELARRLSRLDDADWCDRVLRELTADPRVRAALTVGSPSAAEALDRAERIAVDSRLGRTLHHYLVRMSSRPTPYGLFAGVGVVTWGDATDIAVADARPVTKIRPDMKWLMGLVLELEADAGVRKHLAYVANTATFERGGRLFVSARQSDADGPARHTTVSVRATRIVRLTVRLARTPISHTELVARLADEPGATAHKAEGLVEQLWAREILLTDLRPPLTRADPVRHVLDKLDGIPAAAAAAAWLQRQRDAMVAWENSPFEALDSGYRRLIDESKRPGAEWSATPPQVDMALPLATSGINRHVAREATKAAELLLRLGPAEAMYQLAGYRERFEAAYGHGRRVPLLELLDPNFGLGSPYTGHEPHPKDFAAERNQTLTDLAVDALRDGRTVIELDEPTMARLGTELSVANLPESLDVSVFVMASCAEDIDAGKYLLAIGPNLGGGSAGKGLGRFAELLGEDATRALADVHARESEIRPGVILGELVYLPNEFRDANIAVRPHFREYEIVVGTVAAVAPENVIGLDELEVDVAEGRFRIWWASRDIEIVVTAGHMLNEVSAPDACRFLADVRRAAQRPFAPFDWGTTAMMAALPRVQVGRVVLCPAQFRAADLVHSARKSESMADFISAVVKWRARWRVPRYVFARFVDNRLLVDLDSEFHLNGLRLELQRFTEQTAPLLEEALPAPEHAWLSGPGGRYVSELTVPIYRTAGNDARAAGLPAKVVSRSDRLRPPGSDWLFAKLYCPLYAEDEVIVDCVHQLCSGAVEMGHIDDWFFIRYSDPEPHLRLRFRGRPAVLMTTFFQQLCSWTRQLMDRDLCQRFAVDTYEREVERYGRGAGIDIAERVFGADSRAVARILELEGADRLAMERPVLAAVSCDDLLGTLGVSDGDRLAWCRRALGPTPSTRAQRDRVRELRAVLGAGPSRPGGAELAQILAARRAELAGVDRDIDRLSADRGELLCSYVHMHCNRLLGRDRAAETETLVTLEKALHGLAAAPSNCRPAATS